MAEASHHRLLQLPCSPNQLGCAGSLSSRDHRTLAPDTQPTQSKRRSHLGSNGEAGGRLAPKAANPSSLAQPAFRRQAPEVREAMGRAAEVVAPSSPIRTELMEVTPWSKSMISAEAWPRLIRSRAWWWPSRLARRVGW